MARVGEGYIKLTTGKTERATIFETRKGTEYAVNENGLIFCAWAYEPEAVFEIETEDDDAEVEALLRDYAASEGIS